MITVVLESDGFDDLARPLRVPAADRGAGLDDRRPRPRRFATSTRETVDRVRATATRSPPRRPSSSAPGIELEAREAAPRRAPATRRQRRSTGQRATSTSSRATSPISRARSRRRSRRRAALVARCRAGPDPGRGRAASSGPSAGRSSPASGCAGDAATRASTSPCPPGRRSAPPRTARSRRRERGRERRLRQLHLHRSRRRALDLLRAPVELRGHLRRRSSRAR